MEDAVEAFSDCLLLEPGDARVYSGRGVARFQLKQWPLAVSDFKKAVELDPEDPENWTGLAMGLASDNKIYEAIEVFETLLRKRPQYVRGHIQLARLYYQLGVIAKGHKQLETALTSRPSPAERKTIEELKKEQMAMDKKRYYRPDFEALRRQNQSRSPHGFFQRIRNLFLPRSR